MKYEVYNTSTDEAVETCGHSKYRAKTRAAYYNRRYGVGTHHYRTVFKATTPQEAETGPDTTGNADLGSDDPSQACFAPMQRVCREEFEAAYPPRTAADVGKVVFSRVPDLSDVERVTLTVTEEEPSNG